jgi:hypothetical protein
MELTKQQQQKLNVVESRINDQFEDMITDYIFSHHYDIKGELQTLLQDLQKDNVEVFGKVTLTPYDKRD